MASGTNILRLLEEVQVKSVLFDDTDPPSKKSKSSKANVIKKDPEREEEKPVMKSAIKKGLAPVDSECSNVEMYCVFTEGRVIWDVMLNQTNIQANNNKFYLIQLLGLAL